jgi:hypothetical protein
VIFDNETGRKIEEFTQLKPSVYYARKLEAQANKGNPDDPENLDKFYSNDAYNTKPETDNQYSKTISLPTELKLKDHKPLNDPLSGYGSYLPAGGEIYDADYLLGKRNPDPNVGLTEANPTKHSSGDTEVFGVLNQNTLDERKFIIPKIDKEKNIVLTPKTKEEEELSRTFSNEMLAHLGAKHGMKPDQVFSFIMDLKCDVISVEKIDEALQMITEQSQLQPKKQIVPLKKSTKQKILDPIR